jgi:hypothetical protein
MSHLDTQAAEVRAEGLQRMKVLDRQALLESMHPQLALPASSSSITSGSGSAGSVSTASGLQAAVVPVSQELSLVPAAKPLRVDKGCSHLCDVIGCRLPPERFWEKGGGSGGRGGGVGGGNNSRALTRR